MLHYIAVLLLQIYLFLCYFSYYTVAAADAGNLVSASSLFVDITSANISDSLERIKHVPFKLYGLRYDTSKRTMMGVLGQDAQRWFPESVDVLSSHSIPIPLSQRQNVSGGDNVAVVKVSHRIFGISPLECDCISVRIFRLLTNKSSLCTDLQRYNNWLCWFPRQTVEYLSCDIALAIMEWCLRKLKEGFREKLTSSS